MKSSLSIIVPFLNEEDCILPFILKVEPILKECVEDYEIIFVDDGSTDDSVARLLPFIQENKRIKLIQLSRNFGKDVALTCGIDHATMAAAIPMDIDLQDPPEMIAPLVAKWRSGADVVNAIRANRDSDGWMKRTSAAMFYIFMTKVLKVRMTPNAGDFRLLDRKVLDVVKGMREQNRFMKCLFSWPGFKTESVFYTRPERAAGRTKWNYWKLWNFALGGIIGHSSAPLKWWTYVGVKISALAFIYALILICRVVFYGRDLPGYASIMVCILFLGGIQLVSIGLLGEYIARIYDEVKMRPLYVVDEKKNFN